MFRSLEEEFSDRREVTPLFLSLKPEIIQPVPTINCGGRLLFFDLCLLLAFRQCFLLPSSTNFCEIFRWVTILVSLAHLAAFPYSSHIFPMHKVSSFTSDRDYRKSLLAFTILDPLETFPSHIFFAHVDGPLSVERGAMFPLGLVIDRRGIWNGFRFFP